MMKMASIISTSEISTDQIPFDPSKMKDIFIINSNMTPLIPIDYTIMKSSPLGAIILCHHRHSSLA